MGMTGRDFSWKIWKNDMGRACFWESGRFLTKHRHENSVFFREFTIFWQKIGMRAVIFSFKIGKKGHRIDFFGPEYTSFDKIDFIFDQIWKWGVFYVIWKNHMRLQHFYENERFVDKMGSGRIVCFREWKFFDNIWARHGSIDFFMKFTFLVHSIGGYLHLQGWRFLDQIWAWE